MPKGSFSVPRGAILFELDGIQYEFREDLGEVQPGISQFVGRQRVSGIETREVLIKAVGNDGGRGTKRLLLARARLEEEVRLAKYLDHPGIHRVFGLQKAEGTWYVVSERPRGNNLGTLINLVSECNHWYTPHFAMYIGARLADVLVYAHTAQDEQKRPLNIVHRAIDADHVFLDWKGIVRVSDFGLSLSDLPGRTPSTSQRLHGEGFYSSPEVLFGKRADARADLFSVGVVMLELATGKNLLYSPDEVTPRMKDSVTKSQLERVEQAIEWAQESGADEMVEDIIWRAAIYTQKDVERATQSLPAGMRSVLCKLLHPKLAKRYQTAGELVVALREQTGEVGFGPADAVKELETTVEEASASLAESGLKTPRASKRLGEYTTSG
ncbi:serine/threonine protein kinase [Stigmatella aurantiaca]|uniref:Protein kinase domain protein n=1 Tax=Stigmatella aurantiaca (strain DW4/3-1) TaxID=378806 RepID=Q08ZA6_STIAD|nr:protein kinase [Stigmatella aurantiaca]ADO73912.1 Protein kinase domain protein [Stigmatella aurantiaca DW4/3-1]EAU65828.1 serine/threonine-protein kinase Pkn6, putative [Stigmatella aurantiaca DW4/3-1]